MDFIFKNIITGVTKTVSLSEKEIQFQLEDLLYEKLADCDCQPTGESNVIECGCEKYTEEFVLLERT